MMQRVLKSKWSEQWVTGCLIALLIGLLCSRALLSFASVLISIPFFFGKHRLDKTVLISILLILFPVLISFLWSDNRTEWWVAFSVKIPLLTVFLGLSSVSFTEKKTKQLVNIYLILMVAACSWSAGSYFMNASAIEAAYLKAKVMPTPVDGDYIRFSWMVAAAIILGCKSFAAETRKSIRYTVLACLLFLFVYLHVLAAKTGLLCFYLSMGIFITDLFFLQKKWKQASLWLLAVVFGFFILYQSLPTLRNRIQYIRYDIGLFVQNGSAPGYNDAARWLSVKAGYAITHNNPLYGVGFGDLRAAVEEWHRVNNPNGFPYEHFLPACEWVIYSAGSGWAGMLLFSAGIFLLLYRSTQKTLLSVALSAICLVPLLTDDTLEGQHGVVILAFIVFFGQQKFFQSQEPS